MLYPSNIPYMKTLQRQVLLDRGTPPRQGNLVFLLTTTYQRSIEVMTQRTNLYANGFMYYYFYPQRYEGTIGSKRYRLNHLKVRDGIYEKIKGLSGVNPYPKKLIINSAEKRSTYYDLSTYQVLFMMHTGKLSCTRRVELFWKMFRPIFEDSYGLLNNKAVLINASDYPFSSNLNIKEKMRNPLFLFYLTLYKKFNLVSDLDIDFLIYAGPRVLKINFSKCEEV